MVSKESVPKKYHFSLYFEFEILSTVIYNLSVNFSLTHSAEGKTQNLNILTKKC